MFRALIAFLFSLALSFGAASQSLQLVGVSGAQPATITFIAGTQIEAAGTTFTYSGQSYGAACRDRYLFMLVNWQSTTAGVTGTVTVDGNAATNVVQTDDTANLAHTALFVYSNPVASSGTIELTVSASSANSHLITHVVCNLQSATALTTLSSAVDPSGLGALTTRDGGVAIGVAGQSNSTGAGGCSGGSTTYTWTNATQTTKVCNTSNDRGVSSAIATTSAGTLTVNVDFAAPALARPRTATASFR